MRILYLSSSYVPSRRASSVQVMKTCGAMAKSGNQVSLITKLCPSRQEPGALDDFEYYGVEVRFEITKLPRPAIVGGGLRYLHCMDRELARRRSNVDLVYARDLGGALLSARRGLPFLFEAHGVPETGWQTLLLRRLLRSDLCRRLVVISEALLDLFEELQLAPPALDKVIAHDGADPPARVLRELPRDVPESLRQAPRPLIGYIGHLYEGRGIELIDRLAAALPRLSFHAIGGTSADLARWQARETSPNLTFHPFVPPSKLPAYYEAFDVLLMPYQQRVITASGRHDTSSWMSPLKLFEYMASGKAIVSSDLLVLREILEDGKNALLAAPDDFPAWRQALERLAEDPGLARRLGESAQAQFLEHHTWEARTQKVLASL